MQTRTLVILLSAVLLISLGGGAASAATTLTSYSSWDPFWNPFSLHTTALAPSIFQYQVAGQSSNAMITMDSATYQEGTNQSFGSSGYNSMAVSQGPTQYAGGVAIAGSSISAQKMYLTTGEVGMTEGYSQASMGFGVGVPGAGLMWNDNLVGGSRGAFTGGYVSGISLAAPIQSHVSMSFSTPTGAPDTGMGLFWQTGTMMEGVNKSVTAMQTSSVFNMYTGQFTFATQLDTSIGHPFAQATENVIGGTVTPIPIA
jgi:hypothetical protein